MIETSPTDKELGVLVEETFIMIQQCVLVYQKVNCVLGKTISSREVIQEKTWANSTESGGGSQKGSKRWNVLCMKKGWRG